MELPPDYSCDPFLQMKLLEEEEREKREEEERKERRRMKEREKKLRRKERLKGKEKDKEKKSSALGQAAISADASKEEESIPTVDEEPENAMSCRDSVSEAGDVILSRPGSPDIEDDQYSNGYTTSRMENYCYDSADGEVTTIKDGNGSFQTEQSKFSRRKCRRDVQLDSTLKWSDRRRVPVALESGSVAIRSESRYHGDNFDTQSRVVNGFNRQLWVNSSKSSTRNCSAKYNEKSYHSNNRMNDRYDFHACSCNQQNEYRAKVESHGPATRVSREPKSACKSESSLDMSKQFHRGNKYYQVDGLRDGSGRPKGKIITGSNASCRDSPYSRKVWEPMESQKKYSRSNSDSDVTMRSTTLKGDGAVCDIDPNKSSGETCSFANSGDSFEIDNEDDHMRKSRESSNLTDDACRNRLHLEAKDAYYSTEAGLCHTRNSTLNGVSDAIMSNTSNSDNCSSCLSEGDSNTVFSNQGNMESSSTSDSEDASQQSEGRETPVCSQNGFTKCHEVEIENKQNTGQGEALLNRSFVGPPPDSTETNFKGNQLKKIAENPDKGISTVNVMPPQGIFPPLHNQNVQFPVFQPPSNMGYYHHQNPVSWAAAPANGLLPFPHPNQYLYAGTLGYGLNGNSRYCMPYGSLQHVATPIFNPGPVPVYQPVTKAQGLNLENRTHMSKTDAVQETCNSASKERVGPGRSGLNDAQTKEGGDNDNSGKLRMSNNGFSLFHFGGPVALSTGCKKINPVPSKDEIVGNLSSQFSADHVENDRACNKKETVIEEYNLFAASNGIRFSFF